MSDMCLNMETIRQAALRVGLDDCGVAAAARLDEDASYMEEWLAAGLHGNLDYLERNREKRYDIRQLVPGAQTVVVGLLTYEHSLHDYHRTVKSRLYELESQLGVSPLPTQHIFCDSAPVLERSWAVRARLGFIGKNRQFIHPVWGSKVHLGELVIRNEVSDLPAPPSTFMRAPLCRDCHLCETACVGRVLDGSSWRVQQCVAYETHKCVVCQEVCPYNKK